MINKYSAESRPKSQNKSSGFTIVELLIVVVVIGILAAITIVSYNGVAQRAAGASLQSDLSGASTQLKMYQVENGSYPTTNDCNGGPRPLPPAICLQSSSGNSFWSYSADNSTQLQTFRLVAKNGNNKYGITNDSSPYLIIPVIASGGIMTTFEGYTIHTFNVSGTLAITSGVISSAEILVIGGGGGGGAAAPGYSGGGGAGQFLTINNLSFSGSTTVTVGAGGSAGNNGTSSVLGVYSSIGGGAGGTASVAAKSGASGGGAAKALIGGTGTAGYNGGDGGNDPARCGGGEPGGGGGAGGVGDNGAACIGGGGMWGIKSSITGVEVGYAGGGAAENGSVDGGGGWGNPGVPNTGGGGFANTSGGSGVVIVRYLTD